MIRIITNLKNGAVTQMAIEGGKALPKFVTTNRAAACWLIENGHASTVDLVTFRNAGSDHDSFVPCAVGTWARGNKLFGGPAKSAADHLRDCQKEQPLPPRPRKGTLCAAVWDLMDRLGDVSTAQVIEAGAALGLDAGTVRVQASKWRKARKLRTMRAA